MLIRQNSIRSFDNKIILYNIMNHELIINQFLI